VKRQDHDGRTNADRFGLRCNGSRDRQYGGGITVFDKMVFRKPDVIKAVLVCPTDLLEDFTIDLGVRALPGQRVAEVIKKT